MPPDKRPAGRPTKYDDSVKRTVQMERADWDFAWEYGSRNACLGIQRALQEARARQAITQALQEDRQRLINNAEQATKFYGRNIGNKAKGDKP